MARLSRLSRLARYGIGAAALSAIGAAFLLPALISGSEPAAPARLRADINAAIEERIGHPWRVRRLRVAPAPSSGPSGPFLIDVEVELDEPTFTRLEQADGVTFADPVGEPGYKKRLQGKIWLDQPAAMVLARLDLDNAETLGRMGTPVSRIAGRVVVRGSPDALRLGSASGCPGACPSDRLGQVKHGEDGNRREQDAKDESAQEADASLASEQPDKHRQQ
jgi:hypothetical protein